MRIVITLSVEYAYCLSCNVLSQDGDKATAEEFMENLQKAADSLQGALPKVLDYVCGL